MRGYSQYIKTNKGNLVDILALIISVSSFFSDLSNEDNAKYIILFFVLLTYWISNQIRKFFILITGNEDIYSKLYKIFSKLSIEVSGEQIKKTTNKKQKQ